jgi:hypothetical protein
MLQVEKLAKLFSGMVATGLLALTVAAGELYAVIGSKMCSAPVFGSVTSLRRLRAVGATENKRWAGAAEPAV